HLAIQPFGQIPTYQAGELALFESGAIVFHIADRHPGLLPADPAARARAVTWMFCALDTMQPPIWDFDMAEILEGKKPWFEERLAILADRARRRLGQLSERLADADWLDGDFSAGDLLMVNVLRRLNGTGLLEEWPNIAAYVARGEARPAFRRAFAAQRALAKGGAG
ncbi:MAG: glutathione S-transferase family protein, partial [Mesorhizobium sp.]|nr:glutathione S-transferase family protein [Mesorhizobium sp.]